MSLTWSSPCDVLEKLLFELSRNLVQPKKGTANEFLHTRYADYASVVEAVAPELEALGLLVTQGPGISEDGKVVYVTTRLTSIESGQWVETTPGAPLGKADPQGAGSAITYLRRYGLQALLGIIPEDDDGEGAKRPPQSQQRPVAATTQTTPQRAPWTPTPRPPRTASGNRPGPGLTHIGGSTAGGGFDSKMTPKQHGMIMAICSKRNMEADDRHNLFRFVVGKDSSSDLTSKDASAIIDHLKQVEESERQEEDALLEYAEQNLE